MYAVIFKAEINKLDDKYSKMAKQMQDLAISQYGCSEFISVTEDQLEIAISYWESLDAIKQWKSDSKHLVAQQLGKEQWYKTYKIQIVEIIREYSGQ